MPRLTVLALLAALFLEPGAVLVATEAVTQQTPQPPPQTPVPPRPRRDCEDDPVIS